MLWVNIFIGLCSFLISQPRSLKRDPDRGPSSSISVSVGGRASVGGLKYVSIRLNFHEGNLGTWQAGVGRILQGMYRYYQCWDKKKESKSLECLRNFRTILIYSSTLRNMKAVISSCNLTMPTPQEGNSCQTTETRFDDGRQIAGFVLFLHGARDDLPKLDALDLWY